MKIVSIRRKCQYFTVEVQNKCLNRHSGKAHIYSACSSILSAGAEYGNLFDSDLHCLLHSSCVSDVVVLGEVGIHS